MQQQKTAECTGELEFWPNQTCASNVGAIENGNVQICLHEVKNPSQLTLRLLHIVHDMYLRGSTVVGFALHHFL